MSADKIRRVCVGRERIDHCLLNDERRRFSWMQVHQAITVRPHTWNSRMRTTFDAEADAAYIYLVPEIEPGRAVRNVLIESPHDR
ncbi:hypothetical protein [Microbacterium kribbense]|uniref:hypothetical protein n=1 Tax=Microbacterium kribbense TaxID=433645 RepID=UPI0031D95CBF